MGGNNSLICLGTREFDLPVTGSEVCGLSVAKWKHQSASGTGVKCLREAVFRNEPLLKNLEHLGLYFVYSVNTLIAWFVKGFIR